MNNRKKFRFILGIIWGLGAIKYALTGEYMFTIGFAIVAIIFFASSLKTGDKF